MKVNNVCPNCGGVMEIVNNQFRCAHCWTTFFDIVDSKIDCDVSVMSPEEFGKMIDKNRKQFIVRIDEEVKVFNVDNVIINKKIKDATMALEKGLFEEVAIILSGIKAKILSVERLILLSMFNAKNEYELSLYDGYIDDNIVYKNVVALADKQTKETYIKLAKHCRECYDTRREIEKEILKAEELLEVKLYEEAISYTKEMCKRYPQTALSWAYACEVKLRIDCRYNCNREYSMICMCPDYSEAILPTLLKNKILNLKKTTKDCKDANKDRAKSIKLMSLMMVALSASILLWIYLIEIEFETNDPGIGILASLFYLVVLGAGGYLIASIVFTIRDTRKCLRLKKKYHIEKNFVPEKLTEINNIIYNKKEKMTLAINFLIGIIALFATIIYGVNYIIK